MELIGQQSYFKVERRVSSIEQKDMEEERTIYLYEDRVETKHRTFAIDEVIDMSYHKLGADGGLLYLHTTKGVFPYTVKSSPQNFINLYKKYIKNEM